MAKTDDQSNIPNLNDKTSGKNAEDQTKENSKNIYKSTPDRGSHDTVGQPSDTNARCDFIKTPGGGNIKHTPTLVDILLEYQGLPIHFLSLLTFLLCLS